MKKIFFPFILFFVLTSNLFSQTLSDKYDEYLNKRYEKGDFMGAVMIAKNGKPEYIKALGFANITTKKENNPDLKYLIGSVTKQFTAALILKLQEEGKLSTSDYITKYFPDYKYSDKITIKNLLNHTSGIPNYTSIKKIVGMIPEYENVTEILDSVFILDLEFEPGEKMKYSNTGYLMLGEIIAKESGKTFKEYLNEKIFIPAGMINSDFNAENIKGDDYATGYTKNDSNKIVKSFDIDLKFAGAAGSISSTLSDMLNWDQALYSEKILSQKSKDEMFTPGKDNYGYGFWIEDFKGKKRIMHNGRIFGFISSFMRYTDDSITVIVLSNNDRDIVDQIANELSAITFGENIELKDPVEVTVDPAVYQNYTGVYELSPAFAITITTEDNKIFAQATNQNKFEIFPEAENKFFFKVVEAKIEFVKDDTGKVNKMILFQNGKEMPGIKK